MPEPTTGNSRNASKTRHIFARFVVGARDDEDIWDLSDAAFRLYWSGILWCRGKGNDGLIPRSMVSTLSPVKKPSVAASELERTGFWIVDGKQYVVRNYATYQDTSDVIKRRKQASAAANAAQGKGTGSVTDSVTGSDEL
jgi:hypothetical protein